MSSASIVKDGAGMRLKERLVKGGDSSSSTRDGEALIHSRGKRGGSRVRISWATEPMKVCQQEEWG